MVELADGQDEESRKYVMARRPNLHDSYFLDVLILRIQMCYEPIIFRENMPIRPRTNCQSKYYR